MSTFKEIKPQDMTGNFIRRIAEEWMLIAAEKDGKVNMMTASWGGFGMFWAKPVAHIYVRESRYTKSFIDSAGVFSLTFFGDAYREQLNFCGAKSGRDYDKVAECGLSVLREGGAPYFGEAKLALICKPMVIAELNHSTF
ncbi:MAG: flavin reductase, partial [Oscillospiraceae bacterium]|nr:flavin reductase [Oscillospiraceae bacterium]